MKLWSYTRREVWRRPGRSILTLTGIVIAVAAIVSVTAVTTSTRQAYRDMFSAVTGKAALEVVSPGQGGFDPVIGESLSELPRVEAVVPVVQSPAALVGDDSRVVVVVLGVDPALDGAARSYELEAGALLEGMEQATSGGSAAAAPEDPAAASPADAAESAPAGPGATAPEENAAVTRVLLDASFARAQGLGVGSQAGLLTPSGAVLVEVQGLLQPAGVAAFNGGALVIMHLSEAQRLFGFTDQVNGLQLVVQPGADEKTVEREVGALLPEGLTVQVPASRGQIAQDSLLATEQGLNVISALSLVAAVFIVLNAFLMNVGERRRDLAMLRAVGTTRRQMVRLVLREAALLGTLGTLVGLLLGLGAAVGLTAVMEQLLVITLPTVRLTAASVGLALVLGLGVSLLAAYWPARLAARVSPLEGLTGDGRTGPQGPRRGPALVGVGLTLATLGLALGMIFGRLPTSVSAPAMAFMLVGLVLIIPLALRPLLRGASALLRPLLGTEGSLASRQLLRHPTRTSLTVGVLFVAVTLSISMGTAMLNNVRDTGEWYERTVVGDFFIRGAMPDLGTSTTAALPEALAEEISALPAAERVDMMRFVPGTAGGEQVIVLARTFAPDRPLPLDLVEGEPQAVLAGLQRGELAIGTMLAQRLGVGIGDEVVVETRKGPRSLTVAGTATEYTGGGSALYMEWGLARELLAVRGADVFLVAARPGMAPELGTQLAALAQRDGLMLQSLEELRAFIDEMIGGVLGFLWLLMGMVFVVASLGIVNTLTMNVLEQTRELGLLRAVAMTRGQIRKMILSQALTVGIISLVPGALAGIALAFLLNRVTHTTLGHHVEFRLDPALVIGSFVVALLIAVAAAYFPARRAARLQVVEALQYE
jgi:putative ABC transport system permease protein